ncbi:hypothetical protein [Neokomagataea tanensis]|nr:MULTISPECIES: hypothetical protein [Neokomagataea]
MQPHTSAVIPCPLCRAPLRNTADFCEKCGAERHFGPRRIELISGMIGGCALITTASLLLRPFSLWTVLFALVGIFVGFFYAHVRFGVDRWLKGEGKHK